MTVARILATLRTADRRDRIPQYRHASVARLPWVDQLLNPLVWQVGHWAMFGAMLTFAADIITGLYVFNFFGIGRKFEIAMWLLISGCLGFASITAALYAMFFKSGRSTGAVALGCSLVVGMAPAWLVLNTVLQLILNGGTLPDAPLQW